MDGNGRWAERRGRSRPEGHRAGAEAVRRVVEAAPGLGVSTLTLYAFSQDNWARPAPEVTALMALFAAVLRSETAALRRAGVRLSVVGRRDRLPGVLRAAVCRAEWETRAGARLHLRVAVDYSARDAIRRAVALLPAGDDPTPGAFEAALARAAHPDGVPAPPVDLFLRTGGEQRLSDFLLWESAYAELLFIDTLWPDMTADVLADALGAFARRERRFGALAA